MHLKDAEHEKLKREWVGQVFFSSFTSNSRGVCILIHKWVPFILESYINNKCRKVHYNKRMSIWGKHFSFECLCPTISPS